LKINIITRLKFAHNISVKIPNKRENKRPHLESRENAFSKMIKLPKYFYQAIASKIAEGVVRAGGYGGNRSINESHGVLMKLIFKVIGEAQEDSSLSIINTVDDIKNASVKNGVLSQNNRNHGGLSGNPARSTSAGRFTIPLIR